jgi:tetratricopeptide (TPR) repeat protein
MDPITAALLLAVASGGSEAVGSQVWEGLRALVHRWFRGGAAGRRPDPAARDLAALDRDRGDENAAARLADALAARAELDPDFRAQLEAWHVGAQRVYAGVISGSVVQAQVIHNLTITVPGSAADLASPADPPALESSVHRGHTNSTEATESLTDSRAVLLQWLKNDWPKSGPCVCFLQGFSGIGKSHMAETLMSSGAFQRSSFVEIPDGRTSFQDALLLINESLDRDLDLRLAMGSDLASSLSKVLAEKILLVIDDFQNCLEGDGSPLAGFEDFFSRLRMPRHNGRVLLLTSKAVNEDRLERVSVRTIGSLGKSEGVSLLADMLADVARESEIPEELLSDIVSWLGGNPRALKTLVAGLSHFSLDELIELDSTVWELRNRRMHPEMVQRLERRLISKTYGMVSGDAQRVIRGLSVHRRSFKYEAAEATVGPKLARAIVSELIDVFFLERRRNWYLLNPIVREVASRLLAEEETAYNSAHRAAAAYYTKPFRSKRATASRNAANLIELRYHLMAIGDLSRFSEVAQLYALHLEATFDSKAPMPTNQEEIAQQIAMLGAALAGGSPSPDLHYYLAQLFLARGSPEDEMRAVEELREAIRLPRCPHKAWFLLIDLGDLEATTSALSISLCVPDKFSVQIYRRLAQGLSARGERDEAIRVLLEGINRHGPEHNVVVLYEALGSSLEAVSDSREDARQLFQEGIVRIGPEHNVYQLYLQIAALLVRENRPNEALESLRQGISRIGAEHSVISLYMASIELLTNMDRRNEAVALAYQGISRIDPEHDLVALYLAAAKLMTWPGQRDDAIALLREGIARIHPENNVVALYLALIKQLGAAGRCGEAIGVLREGIACVASEDEVVSLYLSINDLLTVHDEASEAADLLREGIARIHPENNLVALYLALGKQLTAAGKRSEAVGVLRQGIIRVSREGREDDVLTLYRAMDKLLASDES